MLSRNASVLSETSDGCNGKGRDYARLIQANPLAVIDMDTLAPSLRRKLLSEPNQVMRNTESRDRYARRITSLLHKTIQNETAQERNQQIQALNLVDDVLGPKDWEAWKNKDTKDCKFDVKKSMKMLQTELKAHL